MIARSGAEIRIENSLSFHSVNPSGPSAGNSPVRVTTRSTPKRSPWNQVGRTVPGRA